MIARLPKAEGGYRSIGLLPFLPRLWMRTRKNVAAEWEASMQKPYLDVDKKMGSTVAASKQGFRAELDAESGRSVNYSEALLDILKAFDLAPHWVLIREGLSLGYLLWLLRLSLATYKMKRVLRVRKVVSRGHLGVQRHDCGIWYRDHRDESGHDQPRGKSLASSPIGDSHRLR